MKKIFKCILLLSALALKFTTLPVHAEEMSPGAFGLSIGVGRPWIVHVKPELILRFSENRPSLSLFVELNTVVLVSEASYGISLNFENKSDYMNSIYIGSGDEIIASWGDDPEKYRKQYMVGWELKKEYAYYLGYFVNAGLNLVEDPTIVFPKANIGFFFLPGF